MLAFVLGVTVALLFLDEVADRVLGAAGYTVDPDFGEVHDNIVVVYRIEGDGTGHWLDRGQRDTGNGPVHGPRVLVLGDSQTAGLQVNDDETFTSVAERGLRRDGWPVNLLNCGHNNRSIVDYVKRAPAFLRVFRPDWTVVVVQESDFTEDAWDSRKAHLEYAPDGTVRIANLPADPAPRPPKSPPRKLSWRQWWGRKLQFGPIWRYLDRRSGTFAQRWRSEPPLFLAGVPRPASSRPPERPIAEAARLLLDAYAPRLTIVWSREFNPRLRPAPSPGQLQIEELCRQRNVRFVDLSLEFDELVRMGRAPRGFPNTTWNSGHFNRVGHAYVGRRLERELMELHRTGRL